MELHPIKAVSFDMDGTLIDSEAISGEAVNFGYMEVLGREISPEERLRLLGRPVKKILELWFPDVGADIYDTGRRYYESYFSSITAYDGVIELLSRLRGAFRLAVVTSSHRSDAEKLLSLTGLKEFFDLYIAQEDSGRQKPDPEPLILAAQKLGARPEETIMVGDQPYDIIAAHSAGSKAVGALWGAGNLESLMEYRPDYIIKKPGELLSIPDLL